MAEDPQHLDLAKIAFRAAAATPGAWRATAWDGGHCEIYRENGESIADAWSISDSSDANVEFITHAREDVPALVKRVRELTAYLHQIQKHPDFQYAMTFERSSADMTGWERNPALLDAWHGSPGQEALRQQTNPSASRELYWMRRVEQ